MTELDLLKLIENEPDVDKILAADKRWPVLYNFSTARWNILEWYPFKEDASVLEVGAGCGALTGFLCQHCASVTAVELSEDACAVNEVRNQKYENLTIQTGNFMEMPSQQYDYVVMVGTLAYAPYYSDAKDPFVAMLAKAGEFLAPDGKLLLAISNKFGLKYWAGAREDHTGGFYDGLEGYNGTTSLAQTFSKEGLMEKISLAGYTQMDFYYPFPDHRFPTQIFSDACLPKEDDLAVSLEVYDNTRVHTMDENRVFAELLKEGKFDFFANSFFVEVS